jgi:hypothetical protein
MCIRSCARLKRLTISLSGDAGYMLLTQTLFRVEASGINVEQWVPLYFPLRPSFSTSTPKHEGRKSLGDALSASDRSTCHITQTKHACHETVGIQHPLFIHYIFAFLHLKTPITLHLHFYAPVIPRTYVLTYLSFSFRQRNFSHNGTQNPPRPPRTRPAQCGPKLHSLPRPSPYTTRQAAVR